MKPRERIKNAMNFRPVDSIPWVENFYEETVNRFIEQGLPAHKITIVDWQVSGIMLNWPRFLGMDPYGHFGCLNFFGCMVPVDLGPMPRFKQRKISEDATYEEYVMETGARCRIIKRGTRETTWYAMPMFYQFPVTDGKTWNEYKERLNPDDSRRYPKDWEREGYEKIFEAYDAGPTTLAMTGFYGFGAELMGIPNFNVAFYRDPELIEQMISHWEYYTIETIRDAVETLKDKIDMVFWWEDLAERHGPNISPKLYKEFLLAPYKRVTSFLNKNKITRIMMDSDGNTQPVLDLVIEAGITGHWPLEVNSGMDVRTLRKRYNNKLFLAGNLDKREIAKGGKAMQHEIDEKIPLMKETGGYIAGLDHLVHVELSLEKFKEYAEYLNQKLPVG